MIVGISGKIGSGKDTAAQIIRDHTWFITGWENRKFAGKLKQIVSILTGCGVEDLESQEFKSSELPSCWDRWRLTDFGRDTGTVFYSLEEAMEKTPQSNSQHQYIAVREPMTYRLLLQLIGTEGLRGIHQNIHVNALMADYSGALKWIVTDVRFPNEADAIKKAGGILVRITRPGTTSSDHPSETALDDYMGFDFNIHNDGTLQDLSRKLTDLTDLIISRLQLARPK